MRILIAGLGSIGRRHLRNLRALGVEDILLYRTHHSSLPEAELADLPVYPDLTQALAQKPDAVVVSNPTSLHLKVALPAAGAGCHLLLEKPISHSLQGVEKLAKTAQTSGSRVLVGYQFRYHPALQQVRRLLSEGAIGRPLSVHAHWGEYLPGWHPWEDYRLGYSARQDLGGGVVLTLSHPLDYLRWLLGEVEQIWAFAGNFSDLEIDVEDTAEIGLRFRSGVIGSVHLDYNQQPPRHHLEIVGSQGTLRWDNADGSAWLYQGSPGAPSQRSEANWQELPLAEIPGGHQVFERNDLFLAEMRHFLDVIQDQAGPVCTLQDGYQALKLALAALESSAQGRLIHLEPAPETI